MLLKLSLRIIVSMVYVDYNYTFVGLQPSAEKNSFCPAKGKQILFLTWHTKQGILTVGTEDNLIMHFNWKIVLWKRKILKLIIHTDNSNRYCILLFADNSDWMKHFLLVTTKKLYNGRVFSNWIFNFQFFHFAVFSIIQHFPYVLSF